MFDELNIQVCNLRDSDYNNNKKITDLEEDLDEQVTSLVNKLHFFEKGAEMLSCSHSELVTRFNLLDDYLGIELKTIPEAHGYTKKGKK